MRMLPEQFETPRLRILQADDAHLFRALRLAGLRESPAAFGASLEDEVAMSAEQVAARITPTERSWVLGAFADPSALVGCIGWYRDKGAKVAHKSHIWGMYVAPDWRRRGIAQALVAEVIARAGQAPGVIQIELFVSLENTRAARLYEAAGFERVAVLPRSLFTDGRYIDDVLLIRRVP
jgi:ribosomal protein S18 acetylase RimI-like enzyme